MTEYETANLALQPAALTASYWQTGITLAVSSGLVLYGFRLMRRGTDARRTEMDAAVKAAEQRHIETMTVLIAAAGPRFGSAGPCPGSLIEWTAPK